MFHGSHSAVTRSRASKRGVAVLCAAILLAAGSLAIKPRLADAGSGCVWMGLDYSDRAITTDLNGLCTHVGAQHSFQPPGTTSQFTTAWSWNVHWVQDATAYKLVQGAHLGW